jgi:signal transduction histidine kinase
VQPTFDAIAKSATTLCNATSGGVFRFDGSLIHLAAQYGWVPDELGAVRHIYPHPPSRGGVTARAILTREVVHVADTAGDPEYAYPGIFQSGIHTVLSVPMLHDSNPIGAISVTRREVAPFSEAQIELLKTFADQALIAIENVRLFAELRDRTSELTQRQTELRVTFDNMGDGVAMFGETQHLVAWNRKFQDILDVPDDIIARRRTYSEYVRYLAERGEFGPDPEEQVRQFVEQAGRSRTYERTRPDGRVIEVRHNPVPGGGFVLIYADITERKRSEAEIRAARDAAEAAYRDLKAAQANLIQAEKMASLGQLTAGIAHEIKNPLNFVNNFAELSGDLLDELHDAVANNQQAEIDELTATLKGNLAKIAEHGRRADGIVRSMLEHSRGSSGERRSVDLNALVDEALNLAYHGARARDQSFNIALERDFDEGIQPITLVPQDVTRVLLNLFSNGFYAARRRQSMETGAGFEPTLKVVTRELGDGVEIRVRDNGIGIPEEVKDKLFQPFFTTKPTGEGTGLGLSISYDIVTQQHGGRITADSKIGEYSEFTIRLPRNP